uniref:Secreted protein n=1 Tax=Rhipicephalus appendiculatus TaxID=34631 RepID=A0A131YUT2_RHIAP
MILFIFLFVGGVLDGLRISTALSPFECFFGNQLSRGFFHRFISPSCLSLASMRAIKRPCVQSDSSVVSSALCVHLLGIRLCVCEFSTVCLSFCIGKSALNMSQLAQATVLAKYTSKGCMQH